jgi:Immunity protein 26
MKKSKLRYKNGSIFTVPLRTKGYAIGLIVRNYEGYILGYFLNRVFENIPNLDSVKDLFITENISYISIHGSMGLRNKEWIIIGLMDNFNEECWPIPEFKKEVMLLDKTWYGVTYDETFSITTSVERKITEIESKNMPEDGFAGHGFVEIKLTNLLEKI